MKQFIIISVPESSWEPVCRIFEADSPKHAEEQFAVAISDERISWILDSGNPTASASIEKLKT